MAGSTFSRRLARRLVMIVALVLLLLVALYFYVGYRVYTQLGDVRHSCEQHFGNRPDHFTNVSMWPEMDWPSYFMDPYETVSFPSRNPGLELSGWFVAGKPGAPAVILVDGLGGCKYAQAVLVPAGMLWRHGFSVLLLDLHETGDSQVDDGYSTVGADEYLDIEGAWDWLIAEKGFTPERIGVSGNSLGGATALYAFADEPRMAALFLNSPIANLPQVIREELARVGYPTWLAPGGIIMARLLTGQNIVARSPLEEIQHIGNRPVFVVHSTADKRVAVHHSQQLEEAAAQAKAHVAFWFVAGADHVRAAAVYTDEFEKQLVDFFCGALTGCE
ncbi:MAG: prolyl oligopeptidase family serine peptidase [Caldilineaceae bacterium]